MNFRHRRRAEEPEINLIAFIDVLLVIMIFLLVSTTFAQFTGLQLTLPTAQSSAEESKPVEIQVAVDGAGHYAINGRRLAARTPQQLAAELLLVAKGAQEPAVVIHADAAAAHQAVMNVLEAAREAGLARVTFAAQSQAE